MSLLWRNHLRIGLCPDRLLVAAYRRGLKSGKAKHEVVPLQPSSRLAEDTPEWRGAVDALSGVLSAAKKPEVSVVLADQFVRYAILPWNATLKTEEQWLALARHRFTTVHGAAAAGWEVKVTETSPAGPRLACAIERGLIDELADKFAASGAALISVQPFLVAAFNRLTGGGRKRQLSEDGTCWIVVEEPGRLTLALLLRGVWTAIRSRRIDERWRRVLPQILQRESAVLGLEQPCTSVVACTQHAFDAGQYEDWHSYAFDYGDLATAWG